MAIERIEYKKAGQPITAKHQNQQAKTINDLARRFPQFPENLEEPKKSFFPFELIFQNDPAGKKVSFHPSYSGTNNFESSLNDYDVPFLNGSPIIDETDTQFTRPSETLGAGVYEVFLIRGVSASIKAKIEFSTTGASSLPKSPWIEVSRIAKFSIVSSGSSFSVENLQQFAGQAIEISTTEKGPFEVNLYESGGSFTAQVNSGALLFSAGPDTKQIQSTPTNASFTVSSGSKLYAKITYSNDEPDTLEIVDSDGPDTAVNIYIELYEFSTIDGFLVPVKKWGSDFSFSPGGGGSITYPFQISTQVDTSGIDPIFLVSVSSFESSITDDTNGSAIDLSGAGLDTFFTITGSENYILLEADVNTLLETTNWTVKATEDIEESKEIILDETGDLPTQQKVVLCIGKVTENNDQLSFVQYVKNCQILGFLFFNSVLCKGFSSHPFNDRSFA